jgi:hypothetical protein
VIVPTVSMTVRRIVMANDPPTVRTTVYPIVRAPALAERLGMMAPTMSGASDDPCRPAIDLHAATTVRRANASGTTMPSTLWQTVRAFAFRDSPQERRCGR